MHFNLQPSGDEGRTSKGGKCLVRQEENRESVNVQTLSKEVCHGGQNDKLN